MQYVNVCEKEFNFFCQNKIPKVQYHQNSIILQKEDEYLFLSNHVKKKAQTKYITFFLERGVKFLWQ